jgi:hypothetical protein
LVLASWRERQDGAIWRADCIEELSSRRMLWNPEIEPGMNGDKRHQLRYVEGCGYQGNLCLSQFISGEVEFLNTHLYIV